jgi:hypothetical protein
LNNQKKCFNKNSNFVDGFSGQGNAANSEKEKEKVCSPTTEMCAFEKSLLG